jgi:hypothetical protein
MALSQRSLDLDIITLRQVYARGPSNSLIGSNFALLSDGKGGTYWSTVTLGSNSGSGGEGGGIAVSTFSSIIGLQFTTSSITTNTIAADKVTTNTLDYTNFTFNLQTCNIFIQPNFTNAASYPKLVTSNLNYYLNSNDLNSYIFCTSPSNLRFVPPGVTPRTGPTNSYSGQIQGNFFTLKNMGSNILSVVTNPTTSFPIITSTTATFFYLGTPQNFWTPM